MVNVLRKSISVTKSIFSIIILSFNNVAANASTAHDLPMLYKLLGRPRPPRFRRPCVKQKSMCYMIFMRPNDTASIGIFEVH